MPSSRERPNARGTDNASHYPVLGWLLGKKRARACKLCSDDTSEARCCFSVRIIDHFRLPSDW